jgi:hypothetical protein
MAVGGSGTIEITGDRSAIHFDFHLNLARENGVQIAMTDQFAMHVR